MITKDYKYYKELKLAKSIVKSAFKKIIAKTPINVKTKGLQDLVTNIDVLTEKYLIQNINKHFPLDTIISEENNPDNSPNNRSWIIDPIDGTVNFANDIGIWGIQIAFLVKDKPEFCVMYLPCQDEMYCAVINHGAFLNNKPLNKIPQDDSKKHMSILDFAPIYSDLAYNNIKILDENSLKVRILGSSCYTFCKVAKGSYGSFLLYCNNLWDYMPGVILCHECGVKVYQKYLKDYKSRVTLVTCCNKLAKTLGFTKSLL